jgi:hypothetical protein
MEKGEVMGDTARKVMVADLVELAVRRELSVVGLPNAERTEVSRTDRLNIQVKVWGPSGMPDYYNVKVSEVM